MARVLYFVGGEKEATTWGLIHGGEGEVLVYGEAAYIPRTGDFVFLQSATSLDAHIHQYWGTVSAVQIASFQNSDQVGAEMTTEVRVFLDPVTIRHETSRFNRSPDAPDLLGE